MLEQFHWWLDVFYDSVVVPGLLVVYVYNDDVYYAVAVLSCCVVGFSGWFINNGVMQASLSR